MTPQVPCLFLGGPTAVGKSAVASVLADVLDGEIVSVDSMQVYRGLDIGTDKPSMEERQRRPHHLIDEVDLTEPFDVAQFCTRAWAAVAGIQSRGHVPILCGGSGLYFRALLSGVGSAPAAIAPLRTQLESTPLPALLDELRRSDPDTYERIDRNNARRVVRAVEVVRLTGQPAGASRAAWDAAGAAIPGPFIALRRGRDDLRRRIEERVERMFTRGLVEETRRLMAAGLEQNRTALQAIGYRQVVAHVRGQADLPTTLQAVKQRTWQFARRQANWFERHLPTRPLSIAPGEPPDGTARRLLEALPAPAAANA